MHIGLDLDNTLICYDGVFHRIAVEDGFIPAETPDDKTSVRDAMHAAGLRDEWTELQGRVYGSRLAEASLFPGVREVLTRWRDAGHRMTIISHKTRYPFLGEKVDLHAAASGWIEGQNLPVDAVVFRETIGEKVEAIHTRACDAFVDDLREVLVQVQVSCRVWFDADGKQGGDCPSHCILAVSWQEVEKGLAGCRGKIAQ